MTIIHLNNAMAKGIGRGSDTSQRRIDTASLIYYAEQNFLFAFKNFREIRPAVSESV